MNKTHIHALLTTLLLASCSSDPLDTPGDNASANHSSRLDDSPGPHDRDASTDLGGDNAEMGSSANTSGEPPPRYDWSMVEEVHYGLVHEEPYHDERNGPPEPQPIDLSACGYVVGADSIAVIELVSEPQLLSNCEEIASYRFNYKVRAHIGVDVLDNLSDEYIDVYINTSGDDLGDRKDYRDRVLRPGRTFLTGLVFEGGVHYALGMFEIKPLGEELEVEPYPNQEQEYPFTSFAPPRLDEFIAEIRAHRANHHKNCGGPFYQDIDRATMVRILTRSYTGHYCP